VKPENTLQKVPQKELAEAVLNQDKETKKEIIEDVKRSL
jgi:hypothetical protein